MESIHIADNVDHRTSGFVRFEGEEYYGLLIATTVQSAEVYIQRLFWRIQIRNNLFSLFLDMSQPFKTSIVYPWAQLNFPRDVLHPHKHKLI